jgi:hypothetical protein
MMENDVPNPSEMTGIEGMRATLAIALERLRSGEYDQVAMVQVAHLYEVLANLERDAVTASRAAFNARYGDLFDDAPCGGTVTAEPEPEPRFTGGPAREYAEYTPGRIVRDCDDDRYFVSGYTLYGEPFLTEFPDSTPLENPGIGHTMRYIRNAYAPLTITDEFHRDI